MFDNGYVRIVPQETDISRAVNLAFQKTARLSSTDGKADVSQVVDGNTDGDYTHGTVVHTLLDPNAWLDIDLGQVETIDRIRIWNRTDCCGFRLNNYWVFMSETPFSGTDTAATLQGRLGTQNMQVGFPPDPMTTLRTGGVRGRYVRIQLPGKQTGQDYLSIAEVEIFGAYDGALALTSPELPSVEVKEFSTNNANYLHLDFVAEKPTKLEYLFWDNPRVEYVLNGQPVKMVLKNGVFSVDVPAGHNVFELRYKHSVLNIFWAFYALYALAYLWALSNLRVPSHAARMLLQRVIRSR
jgi:hypothetical protein